MNLKELFALFPIALGNMLHNFRLKVSELSSYGLSLWWWKLNAAMFLLYLIDPPFRIVMRNLPEAHIPPENLIYGETPLLTLKSIIARVSPGKDDLFVDLGCGRGLPSFYARTLFNLPSRGVDVLPEYIGRAKSITKMLDLSDIDFECRDILDADLSRGTIFYIAGTTFDNATFNSIAKKLEAIPGKIRVITLSCRLPSEHFSILHEEELQFSWGKAHVYIQAKDEKQSD